MRLPVEVVVVSRRDADAWREVRGSLVHAAVTDGSCSPADGRRARSRTAAHRPCARRSRRRRSVAEHPAVSDAIVGFHAQQAVEKAFSKRYSLRKERSFRSRITSRRSCSCARTAASSRPYRRRRRSPDALRGDAALRRAVAGNTRSRDRAGACRRRDRGGARRRIAGGSPARSVSQVDLVVAIDAVDGLALRLERDLAGSGRDGGPGRGGRRGHGHARGDDTRTTVRAVTARCRRRAAPACDRARSRA
jgi:hypothetical protein